MSDELPELPDASPLTAGEKLVWFGPPGPRGLPGQPGPPGPAGPAGSSGSSSLTVGSTPVAGASGGFTPVLFVSSSGVLAQASTGPYSGFFFDPDGTNLLPGLLRKANTLYLGNSSDAGGILALYDTITGAYGSLNYANGFWVPSGSLAISGYLIEEATTAPASSLLANSQLTAWLTDTPGGVAINWKAKDSSGNVLVWSFPASGLSGAGGSGAGPVGPRGQDGATWSIGQAAPTLSLGSPGDLYLQTGSGDPGRIWQKTVPYFGVPPLWQQQGTLNRGAQGPMGARGTPGPAGPTGPAGPAGSNASATNPILGSFNGKLAQASTTSVTIGPGPGWASWQAILQDGSGNTLKVDSGSTLTISTGATGANGIDSGSQASSTWYYLWVISTGTVTAGLISTSKTAPTLPNGYTYKQLLGAVFSDGSTHLVAFTQIGNRVWVVRQNVFSSQAASLANTYQSQSVSSIVPDIARVAYGMQGNSVTANGTGNAIAADSSGTGEQICFVNVSTSNTALDNFFMAGNFQIPLLTAQTFWWKASTTSAANRIDITGWEY